MLAVDFNDVRAALNGLHNEVSDAIQDVRDYRDIVYSTLPTPSLKEVVKKAVDAPLAAFDARVNQLFATATTVIDASDSIQNRLLALSNQTGGQIIASNLSETANTLEFDVRISLADPSETFTLPSKLEIFDIEFSVGALAGFAASGNLSLTTRIHIEETATTPKVFLVPQGASHELVKIDVGVQVDFGADGYDLANQNPIGMKAIAAGNKVAGVLDFKGAIDFVFDPKFSLQYNSTSASKVEISSLGAPSTRTQSDLELEIPVAFQLVAGALPDFDYRTVFVVDGGVVNEKLNSQRIRVGDIEVYRNGGVVARGDFINQLLVQGGFELVDKIADAIPPEVAHVLLGNQEVFAGLTLDDILFTSIWSNPGVFEAESDPGTPFSILDHLQVFGIPGPIIDIVEFILQVSASKGSVAANSGQIQNNQAGYGLTFPIVDKPLEGLHAILRKQATDIVTFDFDYVRDAALQQGGEQLLQGLINSGAVTNTGNGHRAQIDIDTNRIKDSFRDIISERLGIGGKMAQVIDKAIDLAFDNFDAHFKAEFQAGFRAGIDTQFLVQLQNGQSVNPLDSFYIDANVPFVDFDFDVGLSVSASLTDPLSLQASNSFALAAPKFSSPVSIPSTPTFGETVNKVGDLGSQAIGGISDGAAAGGQIISGVLGVVETSLKATLNIGGNLNAGLKGNGPVRGSLLLNPLSQVYVDANLRAVASVEGKLLGVSLPKLSFGGDVLSIAVGAGGPMVNGQGPGMNDFAELVGNELRVYGADEDDRFTLGYDADRNIILVTLAGATQEFDRASMERVVFDLRGDYDGATGPTIELGRSKDGGNDTLQLLSSLNAMAVPVQVIARGGAGDDEITAYEQGVAYYRGAVTFEGGAGKDRLVGAAGNTTLRGEANDDTIIAGPGFATLDGGGGGDLLDGLQDQGDNVFSFAGGLMVGGAGRDVITVGQRSRGNFLLIGGQIGAGDDEYNIIAGGYGNDRIIGGNALAGNINIADLTSGQGSLITGGPGDDVIFGTKDVDVIIGGWLEANVTSGIDELVGSDGDDLLIVSNVSFAPDKSFVPVETDIDAQSGLEKIAGGAGRDTALVGIGGSQLEVNGDGDDDYLQIGFGSLHNIRGRIRANMGSAANDLIFLDDNANSDNVDYVATPATVASFSNANALPTDPVRQFGGLEYSGATEFLVLNGSDAPNKFVVSPSLDTQFTIDGNLPAARSVPSLLGDFLFLDLSADPAGTFGRKIEFDPPKSGNGRWHFRNSDYKDVKFESMERFNHVERLAVSGEGARDGKPHIKVYDAETKEFLFEFTPYDVDYRDGVRVVTGDVDEDGIPDVIVAPGRLHEPLVRIYDGLGPEAIVAPPAAAASAALSADFNRDGTVNGGDFLKWQQGAHAKEDLALWRENFGSRVDPQPAALSVPATVTSDDYKLAEFMVYDSAFINGVALSVGDVTGDYSNDIVVAPSRGPSEVRVYKNLDFGATFGMYDKFLAYPASFIGGATVAIGDLTGDGRGDIVTSTGSGSYVTVKVFDGARLNSSQNGVPVREFTAFDATARGGSSISIANAIGDRTLDIVLGGGAYANSRVQIFDGAALPAIGTTFATPAMEYQPYTAFEDNTRAPVHVVAKDYDLDGVADAIISAQGADGTSQRIREYYLVDDSLVDALFENADEFLDGFWLG